MNIKKRLNLEKLKNQQMDLNINNVFISENIIPFTPNKKSILKEFDIDNIFINEYIIKTNTNSLKDYDIAVTNLGTVIYNTDKFENFILCLDNTNRFMITAKVDKIPMLWSDDYYKPNEVTIDYIVYSSNRLINDFGIFNILNLQYLIYTDYKTTTYKKLFNKSYHYNFIEFLCSNFFKDINNIKFNSIKNVIISIYKELYNVKIKDIDLKNISSELLLKYRKDSKRNVFDFKLFIEFRNRSVKLVGDYCKTSMMSAYERKSNFIPHNISTFINFDFTSHLSNIVKSFCEHIFNSNYILSKIFYINYTFYDKNDKILPNHDRYIHKLISDLNPDIDINCIKEIFNFQNLIRYSGKNLILSTNLKEIYSYMFKDSYYMKYIFKRYNLNKSMNIPDYPINISYNLTFKNINYLRVQKMLIEDKHLRSIIYSHSYFQNTSEFLVERYNFIRRYIMQILIDILYELSEPFIFAHRKHMSLQRKYHELSLVINFDTYIDNLRSKLYSYKKCKSNSGSIDGFYISNKMDDTYNHEIYDFIDSKDYFNITSKNNFKIGCLSSMRKIIRIMTFSDSIIYLVDHNDNSLHTYNHYFFDSITKKILKEFNPD